MATIYEDGEIIEVPDSDVIRPNPEGHDDNITFIVTSSQAKMVLLKAGLLEQVESIVGQSPKEVEIWYNAPYWERNSIYVNQIGQTLGLSKEKIDEFFEEASREGTSTSPKE